TGGKGQGPAVVNRLATLDQDTHIGPDTQRRPRCHLEAPGKDVTQVRRVGADLVQVQLAGGEGAGVDVDVMEGRVVPQVLYVVVRHVDGQVERIAGQVAAVQHAAVV